MQKHLLRMLLFAVAFTVGAGQLTAQDRLSSGNSSGWIPLSAPTGLHKIRYRTLPLLPTFQYPCLNLLRSSPHS